MANYPAASTIRRKTTVTPINPAAIDQADGGGIRVASLAAIQRYRIDIMHPLVDGDAVDALMGFWAAYQDQQIAIVRGSRMVYLAPFVNEPEIEEITGTYYNVKLRLEGRRIPSVMPAGYGHFETSPSVTVSAGDATASFDTAVAKFGAQSLKLTKNTTDAVATSIHLAAGATTYNTTLTANRKWLLVASLRMSVARTIDFSLRLSDGSYISGGTSYTPAAVDTWYRAARILDASASALVAGHVRFSWSSAAAATETLRLDGVTLFDVTDYTDDITESTFPTIYMPPEP